MTEIKKDRLSGTINKKDQRISETTRKWIKFAIFLAFLLFFFVGAENIVKVSKADEYGYELYYKISDSSNPGSYSNIIDTIEDFRMDKWYENVYSTFDASMQLYDGNYRMYIRHYVSYLNWGYDYTTYYHFGDMDHVSFTTEDGLRYFHFRVTFVELETPPKLYVLWWIFAAISLLAYVEFEGIAKFLRESHE